MASSMLCIPRVVSRGPAPRGRRCLLQLLRHRVAVRRCSSGRDASAPPAVQKNAEDAVAQLYGEKGGYMKAVQAEARERQRHRDELFADDEFRKRLGHIPDKYQLMNPEANIEQSKFLKNSTFMPGLLLAMTLALGGAAVYFQHAKEERRYKKTKVTERLEGASYVGRPRIGGDFDLLNAKTGERFRSVDCRGKWLYIYFGFANCPDICPREMRKLGKVTLELQEHLGDKFVPVFITVDPKRDQSEELLEYVSDMHPDIVPLTGTPEEILKVARMFRVFFAVPDIETFTESDYLVDHSIITYLIDPHGRMADYTTKEHSTKEATLACKAAIHEWENEMVRNYGKHPEAERPEVHPGLAPVSISHTGDLTYHRLDIPNAAN
eukprot:TRINITY_DN20008_c0_g1_i1.p1 TRINITY_DN20008_c0_g1~~TRINITY_DN20008_c0_g1_i1.p1  ORF type:complete len:380 (+),score=96.31 TRINITY_DN20008_c0_g1_i1:52-1191(+)